MYVSWLWDFNNSRSVWIRCSACSLSKSASPPQVMKRQAGMVQGEDDDDEEEEDDYDDESDEDLARAVENLNVFCVSSTEYLKLCNKLPKDGPPMVGCSKGYCVCGNKLNIAHEAAYHSLNASSYFRALVLFIGKVLTSLIHLHWHRQHWKKILFQDFLC